METTEALQGTYTIAQAYAYCEALARSHYENFPVGSWLIPKSLRPDVWAIYAFARHADDLADEGTMPIEDRLRLLDEWEENLNQACQGKATHPVFVALAETIRRRNIPRDPLNDLLKAFRMDARNQGFETTTDLLYYCFHSANPIGRLVLRLFEFDDPERVDYADKICTALQMANFWQDVSVDVPRGRINIPRQSMEYFGYSVHELKAGLFNDNFREVIAYHVDHAINLFQHGYPLLRKIPNRRLRTELTITFLGGVRILNRIKAAGYNVLKSRPTLGLRDKLWILMRLAGEA